jgi:galactokinase
LTDEDFELYEHLIKNFNVHKRVDHAVHENTRTNKAVKALKKGDLVEMGRLMNESHDSLRDLYEVSCKELDTLVDYFRDNNAIGARMTGAGFGGCAIALVATKDVENVIKNVRKGYFEKIGYHADFYPVSTSDGTKKIMVEE